MKTLLALSVVLMSAASFAAPANCTGKAVRLAKESVGQRGQFWSVSTVPSFRSYLQTYEVEFLNQELGSVETVRVAVLKSDCTAVSVVPLNPGLGEFL